MQAKEAVPVDRNRDFRKYDYPKKPGIYTPSVHFGQRVREEERYLNGERIDTIIKDGEVRDNEDGCACFVKEWGGVTYYLIAGFHEDGYRIIVTAWPHLEDREEALDSGMWSEEQLDRIEQFNAGEKHEGAKKYADWLSEH